MKLPKPESGSFELVPAGNHLGMCWQVIDLGTQTMTYQEEVKKMRRVLIGWELPNELMADGRPFVVSRRYTFSVHEKATFRKHLENWRGKKFTDEDFGDDGFDVRNLIGKACFVNVVHQQTGDKVYANVDSIAQLPKGMAIPPELHNDPIYLSLEPEEFDSAVYSSLPEWLQKVIFDAPEFARLATGGQLRDVEIKEELPF
jgi:hypothetical protein